MNREQAQNYLRSSGMSEEQIAEVESAFTCEDAISRQMALDAFGLSEKTRKWGGDHSGYDTMMLYEIQDTLEDLPSVSTEKTGRWIESNGVEMFVCSVCNESFYPMPTCLGKPLMKYCPNCGSRMNGGAEE